MVKESDASIPILTHSMQYGSGIFEGVRAYSTRNGTAIFRLKDHMKRFARSAKIYSIDLGYSQEQLFEAICKLVKANKLDSGYIRPFAFYDDHNIGMSTAGKKISVSVCAVPFGAYFGGGKEIGVSCKVSSWKRINSSILPVEAKASGNYLNSIIASSEAKRTGADEAILLSTNGYVAEGPGENIFLVEDGKLVTPSKDSDILLGITRHSIIKIAEFMGIEVLERNVHREELYIADEVFFSGTAAEITPITSIDSIKIGKGKPGPLTKMLAQKYSEVVLGKESNFKYWLTYI